MVVSKCIMLLCSNLINSYNVIFVHLFRNVSDVTALRNIYNNDAMTT